MGTRTSRTKPTEANSPTGRWLRERVGRIARTVTFWTAAFLPVTYVPVFLEFGLGPFLGLLLVHVLSLLASHDHTP